MRGVSNKVKFRAVKGGKVFNTMKRMYTMGNMSFREVGGDVKRNKKKREQKMHKEKNKTQEKGKI
jgi:hypothetical protein